MESKNKLPEFTIDNSDIEFERKPLTVCVPRTIPVDFSTGIATWVGVNKAFSSDEAIVELSIEEVMLRRAEINCIKVQSVSLPKRIADPINNKSIINDWFTSFPIYREYPVDIMPYIHTLELDDDVFFNEL